MYCLFNLHKDRIGLNGFQAVNVGMPLVSFTLSALWFGTSPSYEVDVDRMQLPLAVIDLIPEAKVFISAGRLNPLLFGYVICLFLSVVFLPPTVSWALKEEIDPRARLIMSRPVSVMAAVLLIALSLLIYAVPFTELRTSGVRNIVWWYVLATWLFVLPLMFVPDAIIIARMLGTVPASR